MSFKIAFHILLLKGLYLSILDCPNCDEEMETLCERHEKAVKEQANNVLEELE